MLLCLFFWNQGLLIIAPVMDCYVLVGGVCYLAYLDAVCTALVTFSDEWQLRSARTFPDMALCDNGFLG